MIEQEQDLKESDLIEDKLRRSSGLSALYNNIRSCPNTIKNRQMLFHQLRSVVQAIWGPLAELTSFGSVATGFHTKDSDLDLYLKLPKDHYLASSSSPSLSPSTTSTPLPHLSLSQHSPPSPSSLSSSRSSSPSSSRSSSPTAPITTYHSRASAILRELFEQMMYEPQLRHYYRFETIFFARVPILRVHWTLVNLTCDISVDGDFGHDYRKSLLRKWASMDWRVKPLILMIKHWARNLMLDDSRNGLLPRYGWTLMVIQYLQLIQPPILPCLHKLPHHLGDFSSSATTSSSSSVSSSASSSLSSSSSTFALSIELLEKLRQLKLDDFEGWVSNSISDDSELDGLSAESRFDPTLNKMTVDELLLGFFKFYSQFDFKRNVVSVRTAQVTKDLLPPPAFAGRESENRPYYNFEPKRFITIEDVYDVWDNVTRGVGELESQRIQWELTVAHRLLEPYYHQYEKMKAKWATAQGPLHPFSFPPEAVVQIFGPVSKPQPTNSHGKRGGKYRHRKNPPPTITASVPTQATRLIFTPPSPPTRPQATPPQQQHPSSFSLFSLPLPSTPSMEDKDNSPPYSSRRSSSPSSPESPTSAQTYSHKSSYQTQRPGYRSSSASKDSHSGYPTYKPTSHKSASNTDSGYKQQHQSSFKSDSYYRPATWTKKRPSASSSSERPSYSTNPSYLQPTNSRGHGYF